MFRLENSQDSHMVVIWNEFTKQEESSADVSFMSKVLVDEDNNIYLLDPENGLVNMAADAGGCKNLAFRGW